YGRNESLLAEVGDWVSPGQQIAVAGASGGGRAGLYFQLRRDGRPVDPAAWIRR
ncbi:MAG: peptidoglycan DD-metalloendopeptidase family protein, partial [Wenzhouxiangellaceae bacterium]